MIESDGINSVKSPTYRLAAVKECLYNPELPTLRRMDMDSIACKLPHENSRLNTRCGADDFRRTANSTRYIRTSRPLASMNIKKESSDAEISTTLETTPDNVDDPSDGG